MPEPASVPGADSVALLFSHSGVGREFIHALKYRGERAIARWLGDSLALTHCAVADAVPVRIDTASDLPVRIDTASDLPMRIDTASDLPMGAPGRPRRPLIAEPAVSIRPKRWRVPQRRRSACVLQGCCGGSVPQRSRAQDGQRGWLDPASELVRARRAGGCCWSTTCSPPARRCGRQPLRWRVPVLPSFMWQRVHDGVATSIPQVPNMALPSFRAVQTKLSTCSGS